MSFATTKEKQTTARFMLIRMAPARCIDSDLTLSDSVYSMSWDRPVAKLERNGTALTADSAAPTANDHYYYDEDAGTLTVKLADAPDDTTNVLVLHFYLFFTSGMAILATEDPTDSSTPMRQWEPKVQTAPTLSQSVGNLLTGVFTIADGSVDCVNTDSFFNQWLGPNDSFNEKDVDVWQGIRSRDADTPDYQRVYRGKVKAVNVTPQTTSFTFYDAFSRLTQPALMGDTGDEAYFSRLSSSFPDTYPDDDKKPIPFVINKNRYGFGASVDYRYQNTYPGPTLVTRRGMIDCSSSTNAVCTSYSDSLTTSDNRTWGLCRIPSAGLKELNFGTIYSAVVQDTGVSSNYPVKYRYDPLTVGFATFSGIHIYTTSDHNLEVGDSFKFSHSDVRDGVDLYAVVVKVVSQESAPHDGIYCMCTSMTGSAGITITSGTFSTNAAPAIAVFDQRSNYTYYPLYGRDFTYTTSTTSGENKYLSITFVDGFETATNLDSDSNHPGMNILTPSTHKVAFRTSVDISDGGATHGSILKKIMETAGLTADASSFTAADTTLTANCRFTIPQFDETDYKSYLEYSQLILQSTLGIVSLDSSAQVQYSLIAAPSSSDETSENIYLRDSLQISVDYSDIVTQLIAYNPHVIDQDSIDASTSPSETRVNLKAQYLHGVDNTNRFRHVLETITDRIDQIMHALSNRRATYSFDVATKYLDGAIGDDVKLKTSYLLGDDMDREVKIVSLDKSTAKVSVQAIDLEGVT